MARLKNVNPTGRIFISPSTAVGAYLDEIATIGIYGKTRAEVAERLIGHGIAQLIKDGLLAEARRPTGRARGTKR